jgi:acetylcholinesterase
MQIPFVFGNTEQQLTPLGDDPANLSRLVMRMWTSFAYDLNPNGHGSECSLVVAEACANE